jgi:hypothetical protein
MLTHQRKFLSVHWRTSKTSKYISFNIDVTRVRKDGHMAQVLGDAKKNTLIIQLELNSKKKYSIGRLNKWRRNL